MNLRWRQNGRKLWERVGRIDAPDIMSKAVLRATELNRELEAGRSPAYFFTEATLREACDIYIAAKEAAPDVSGGSIHKYASQLARVLEFAEKTPEGRRCKLLHQVDSVWCQRLSSWLDCLRSTRNGGPVTSKNPERPLNPAVKRETKRLLSSVIEHAMLRNPPLAPPVFRNPMSPVLVGRERRIGNDVSDPPVSYEDLVAIVSVLDQYALGLLAPLFLYGPRPSELGHIIRSDCTDGFLQVVSRPESGYETKGRRNKAWPVTDALTACIRPFLANSAGPLFVKRRIFEGKTHPALAGATQEMLAGECERRSAREAQLRGQPLGKEDLERISDVVWAAAGAVDARDVQRELERAAVKARLPRIPTPKDLRHLAESECEAARLSAGVIRYLLGHAPVRGDALIHYNHTGRSVLREQVAILDQRRQPLIEALLSRAHKLQKKERTQVRVGANGARPDCREHHGRGRVKERLS